MAVPDEGTDALRRRPRRAFAVSRLDGIAMSILRVQAESDTAVDDSPATAPSSGGSRSNEEGVATRWSNLARQYRTVRAFTESLRAPLAVEDCVVQTMEDVSPTKWHLAHTSWFFEAFVLREYLQEYELFNPEYPYLFNSYYVQAGERHCRDRRGYISRPTVAEIGAYRRHVDDQMARFFDDASEDVAREALTVVEIGIHHEQQHQELLLTDIKHVLSVNPLRPAYREVPQEAPENRKDVRQSRDTDVPSELRWLRFDEGICEIGHDGKAFCYDNEGPRHRHYLEEFLLGSRLVTNGEFLEFMADGGYERPELWLSMGWATVEENEWTEPFYWEMRDGEWWMYTLGGMRKVDPREPVCHVSYFEADAYALWSGARLPTEQEWEVAARTSPIDGNFVDEGRLHPTPAAGDANGGLQQLYGDVWEWTRSQYSPYPGYRPAEGALGEYNGKFMCNQFVLRGGSCATSKSHIRPTYRNFFPPEATWQFTGFRLARDL